MDGTLNLEQREIVEENYDLVFEVMDKYNLREEDIEDWHGLCAVVLCESALKYCAELPLTFRQFARARMIEAVRRSRETNR